MLVKINRLPGTTSVEISFRVRLESTPTALQSFSFSGFIAPFCVASRSFNTIQRSQSLLAAALFGGVAMSGAFWDAAHGPALLPMALPWSCSCHLIAMTLRLMGLP